MNRATMAGALVLIVIVASGVGYFVYSRASSKVVEVNITLGYGSAYITGPNATVSLGQKVEFVVFNDDNNPHVFGIAAFNASTGVIGPSYTARISFVANQEGVFPYYSPLNSSQVQGFTNVNGTLTVTG